MTSIRNPQGLSVVNIRYCQRFYDLYSSLPNLPQLVEELVSVPWGQHRCIIEFMLLALRDALVDVKRSVGKGVVKSVAKILDLIAQYPDITRERLAREVGLSVRGVEKNLAQLKSEGKIVRVGGRLGPTCR